MRRKYIVYLLSTYFLVTLTTFLFWKSKNINDLTGDEPHFLVMTSGLVRHGGLEQSAPYAEEFKTRELYKPGLGGATHSVAGPHGLYNMHGIGLPLMLMIPFLLGGALGAKLFMILLGAGVVVVTWKIASIFVPDENARLVAVLATCIGLPLIPASSQIYTDIPAGLVSLIGVYWFMTAEKNRPLFQCILLAILLAFLPWLHVRYAATCLVLMVGILWKINRAENGSPRIALSVLVALLVLLSLGGLAAYNLYAFSNACGPMTATLEISKTSLMVLLGLFLDQNQGFLLQNPIMFVGVLFAGGLFVFDKRLFVLWLLVFLSLIVPNSLQISQYGGWSFSGRFEWAAYVVFILPTMFGLSRVFVADSWIFYITSVIGLCIQIFYFCLYTFTAAGASLYNHPASTWIHSYSIFHNSIYCWLPALYNVNFAYAYWPNYGWFVVLCILVITGFVVSKDATFPSTKGSLALFTSCVCIVLISGSILKYDRHSILRRPLVIYGKDLPSVVGRLDGNTRMAVEGVDLPGYVSFGPYIELPEGSYRVSVRYSSNAPVGRDIGAFDVATGVGATELQNVKLLGTEGRVQAVSVIFAARHNSDELNMFQFRNLWKGSSDLRVLDVKVERL